MRLHLLFAVALFSLVACTEDPSTLDKGSKTADDAQQIDLLEQTQLVIKYDCDSKEISRGTETVKRPFKWVTISPDSKDNLGKSSFYNKTTKSYADTIVGSETFKIDYRVDKKMRVTDGVNEIEYKFYSCDEWHETDDGYRYCKVAQTIQEEGLLFVDILYSKQHISSPKSEYPDDCPGE